MKVKQSQIEMMKQDQEQLGHGKEKEGEIKTKVLSVT
jgi:hypothetical protein